MAGNPLKQLAGETAVYGMSTILARIINFLFVPFYTRLLTTSDYGTVTEFMAYIAVLQVVLVMGLETGCFRFANRDGVQPREVWSSALAAVSATGFAFLALTVVFAEPLARLLGYDAYGNCIMYTGGILALDSITAILFAKLRQEHRAVKFAVFKTIKILVETGGNILLFFPFASFCARKAAALGVETSALTPSDVWLLHFVSPTPDFSYVIAAILLSCIVCSLLFIPELVRMDRKFNGGLLRKMLAYSLPLMVAALPGIVNDFLDRILFRFLDTNAAQWQSSLGIFQAAVKLAVIMNLFIQMFRFAAEPFFFQRAGNRNSKTLYARVMELFTAFCGFVFLGVIFYIDIISLLLGRDFRGGIGVVPVMLFSYMVLGMLFNVSMWYKLSGKTGMAIWITSAGLLVTFVVNLVFMPKYSYWAAAFGHLASYVVMFIISAVLGQKHWPVPYRWGRIAATLALMFLFYGIATAMDNALFNFAGWDTDRGLLWWKLGVHTVLLAGYVASAWALLRKAPSAEEGTAAAETAADKTATPGNERPEGN